MTTAQQPGPGWRVVDGHHLEKEVEFPDFMTGLRFVNRIAELAEAANHHPDIYLAWGKVRITLYTHDTNGLTRRDYDLAAQIDHLE